MQPKQNFDHFFIVDFEATCIKDMRINPQEIIQFPCLHVNGQTFKRIDEFHFSVKPVYRPKLSPFCIKLTGIKQDVVDKAHKFSEVFSEFVKWVRKQDVANKRAIFVTCGDWDLGTMLPNQCELSKINHPNFVRSWINLKKEFTRLESQMINRGENDLLQMMKHYGLDYEGRLHDGRDDVKNIARLLEVMCRQATLQATEVHESFVDGRMPEIVWEAEQKVSPVAGGSKIVPDKIKTRLAAPALPQKYELILVLDFEATCLKDMKINPQEIIEFPCIILDTKTYAIKDIFHNYVRPVERPRLSPFCTKLTGITQGMVDESKTFKEVFQLFIEWIKNEKLTDRKFVLATCGDWDLQTLLPSQLNTSKITQVPDYLRRWVNVKKVFEAETGIVIAKENNDLHQMMEGLGLKAMGSLHSGIDDVKNIARVVEALSHFTVLEATTILEN